MPQTRQELENHESLLLAPCAQLSGQTRGRTHKEASPEWRTQYQRDRDRIIHSRAFRRLEYKTQVFLNGAGDHLRTRLTHTMEVAAIARNIAQALRLNQDLTESIALAHDLGHSPFGHNGETALQTLMQHHGGFEHNRQSLRSEEH
ncbi:MAG: dGTP triphosphohydrolase, partial [Limisphaerales bacterium]